MKYLLSFMFFILSTNVTAEENYENLRQEIEFLKLERFNYWLQNPIEISEPISEKTILALGKVKNIKSEIYSSLHDDAIKVESKIFFFDGLEIKLIIVNNYQKSYFEYIKISSNQWALTNGIAIGQKPDSLSKLSVQAEKGTLNYCGNSDCINFSIKNGKINTIEVNYYTD